MTASRFGFACLLVAFAGIALALWADRRAEFVVTSPHGRLHVRDCAVVSWACSAVAPGQDPED